MWTTTAWPCDAARPQANAFVVARMPADDRDAIPVKIDALAMAARASDAPANA